MPAERIEKRAGFAGEQMVVLPARTIDSARRRHPALNGLLAVAAGYFPRAAGHLRRRPAGCEQAVILYCVKGGGWCELQGKLHPLRAGDLAILPPRVPHAYAAHQSNPWTIHWVHASGAHVEEYLAALGTSADTPIIAQGDDLQIVLLFNEVLKSLQHGGEFPQLLLAAHALGQLLALAMQNGRKAGIGQGGGLQKVAQCITYMSEHLERPLKISEMAALASLSPAHFTALFKEQTGSAPRDYLHFLRMHQACQWLPGTTWSLKEIASRLGYQDQFHFSRKFKAFSGVSPSGYRQKGSSSFSANGTG